MRIQEAIRRLMKEQHVTLEDMGERMGGITKMAVHGALNGRKQKSEYIKPRFLLFATLP